MGLSIVAHVEVNTFMGWKKMEMPEDWFVPSILSGVLAGVRNWTASEPIAEPRGIPEGASWEVMRDWIEHANDSGMGMESWVSYEELKAAYREPEQGLIPAEDGGTEFVVLDETEADVAFNLRALIDSLETRWDQVRLVFWFSF